MQPSRRSARLKQAMETTETASSPSLPTGPSTYHKQKRKRPSPPAAPRPESSPPHVELLSASPEEEIENFLPKEPSYEASREIFQARAREFPDPLHPKRRPITTVSHQLERQRDIKL
ncbi:hypothetical protein F2Q70_00035910 [Brassica cretica]|uniref:Uncharacterized protein n=1 Tax=Brassica cretica TaxID=69181 RepID=A0A8S9JPY7_BRACR|nr:hypothetical protein F2Q70_00035910 [Brassica cretica]